MDDYQLSHGTRLQCMVISYSAYYLQKNISLAHMDPSHLTFPALCALIIGLEPLGTSAPPLHAVRVTDAALARVKAQITQETEDDDGAVIAENVVAGGGGHGVVGEGVATGGLVQGRGGVWIWEKGTVLSMKLAEESFVNIKRHKKSPEKD